MFSHLNFKFKFNDKRNFNVSSLKDEQKEAAVHLLRSKDVVAILPTGFEESLICYIAGSLRSKRFRGAWEQRKTEERDFRCFACAENGARAKR